MTKLLALLLLGLFVIVGQAQVTHVAVRSIAVKGNLKCGNRAAENVKVVLYRVDSKGFLFYFFNNF